MRSSISARCAATPETSCSVNTRVLAVGADNMAWDVIGPADPEYGELPGHLILLARSGIYIIENLQLEELAAAGRYRFSFICTPLKFVGATGSPVRPIALVTPAP